MELIGERVEVRPYNTDELFFDAVITNFDAESETYSVRYEDGEEECYIRESSVLHPNTRKVVYQDQVIRVVDGHMFINGELRSARLLSFMENLTLYQSAILFSQAEPDQFDYTTLAFDVDQALVLSIPLFYGIQKKRDIDEALHGLTLVGSRLKVLVLGAGGGSVTMAMHEMDSNCTITVVDISEQVIRMSHEFFGVPESDPRLRVQVCDAYTFLDDDANCSVLYDIIVVDIADFYAEEDAACELPPEIFLEQYFLVETLGRVTHDNTWIVINVIANRERLTILIHDLQQWFCTVYVLATDPNYVFMVTNGTHNISHTELYEWSRPFEHMSRSVLQEVKETNKHRGNGVLLGWYHAKEFETLVNNEKILV